jgi:hypothetical protein
MRKVIVPKAISMAIGSFAISRRLTVRVLTAVHSEIPAQYNTFRPHGSTGTGYCRCRISVEENGQTHIFTFFVDDMTSPDHLLIVSVHHTVRK